MGKKTGALRIVGLPVGKIGGKIGGKIVGMIVGMALITGCLPSHAPFHQRTAGYQKIGGPFDEAEHTKRLCTAVANYIAAQYHSVTPNSQPLHHKHLPVQHHDKTDKTAFVSLEIPSRYEIIFQHKGYQATLDYCFERHRNKSR